MKSALPLLLATVAGVALVAQQRPASPAEPAPLHHPRIFRARYLTATTGTLEAAPASGRPVALAVDVVPNPGLHVYTPEQEGYKQVRVSVNDAPALEADPPRYPPGGTYFFAPLNETFKVYTSAFRVLVDVRVSDWPVAKPLEIAGSLEYQACDDSVCYRPETVALSWTVPRPGRVDSQRAPVIQLTSR